MERKLYITRALKDHLAEPENYRQLTDLAAAKKHMEILGWGLTTSYKRHKLLLPKSEQVYFDCAGLEKPTRLPVFYYLMRIKSTKTRTLRDR